MHEPQTDPKDIREGKKIKAKSRLQKRWIFFGILALVFVAAYCIVNRDRLASFFSSAEGIGNVLSPLFIGCIIAYLLNPILKFYEYFVFRKLKPRLDKLRNGLLSHLGRQTKPEDEPTGPADTDPPATDGDSTES